MSPQQGKNELPIPARHLSFPLIGPPFIFQYISKEVLGNNFCGGENSRRRAAGLVKRSATTKTKYLLYLLHVGSELQKSLNTLETTRTLEVKKLQEMIVLGSHPVFKAENARRGSDHTITDRNFLIWHMVFTDLLLMLRSHLLNFVSNYQLAKMPEYNL